MKNILRHLALTAISLFLVTQIYSQEANQTPLDTLTSSVSKLESELTVLKRLKFSGYIQGQFQIADSAGIKSYAGGDFANGVDKRFMLRRSRIKAQYQGAPNNKGISSSMYVLQIDITEKGASIRDAYAKVTDPWTGWFNITVGMQDRPFGYEIGYSSSLRESPERGKMSQIIFPNERDLGAMLTIQGTHASGWNWLKLEAGMFNGTGNPSAGVNTSDFDKFKDLCSHLSVARTTKNEKISWGAGVSYYNGGFRVDSVNVYRKGVDSLGSQAFLVSTHAVDNYNDGNVRYRGATSREYAGVDARISFDWLPGITTLRAEYIQGAQPGISSSTNSPIAPVSSDIYYRNFNGAYLYFVQNISNWPIQAVVKYDWYDPNTEVSGDQIGSKVVGKGTKAFNSTDIKFETLGFGLTYKIDANVKIMAYYDKVKNETSANLAGFTKDLSDNVLTLRLQARF